VLACYLGQDLSNVRFAADLFHLAAKVIEAAAKLTETEKIIEAVAKFTETPAVKSE
jgi:hypothetical protein